LACVLATRFGDRLPWDHDEVRWRSDRSARARWAVAGVLAAAAVGVGATLGGALLASSDGYALNFGGEPLGPRSPTTARHSLAA
jgi:hypothetical protein